MPPPAQPQPGWTPVDPFPSIGSSRSFVSGQTSGPRLRVAYFRRDRDGALVAKVWFGPGTEGPPGCAHGGSVAAALDEAMSGAAWISGYGVVAARLEVDFREMVPLGTDAVLEAWVEQVQGRKVATRGRLTGPDGRLYAESQGLFITLEQSQMDTLVRRLMEQSTEQS